MNDPIDHYGDGAWYDAEYVHIGGDIPYYSGVAGAVGGPILELACGTGRLTIPMVQSGATVHGIDVAPAMIAQARRKRADLSVDQQARLSFEIADMRTAALGRSFAGVVLGFNTIMHMLTDEDLFAALRTAHDHLRPDGRFFLDLHTPLHELLTRSPHERYDPQQMIDPHTGERYVVTESSRYDPRHQINTMRFYYQAVDTEGRPTRPERYTEVQLRVLFPRELDHWMTRAGFEVVEDWDDFERAQRFTGAGGRRVMVAARR